MQKNILSRLTKIIAAFIISTLLFVVIDVDGDIYLLFFMVIWLAVLLQFGNRQNCNLLQDLLVFSFGNVASYSWIYYLNHGVPKVIPFEKRVMLTVCMIELFVAALLVVFEDKKYRKQSDAMPKSFKARQYDLQRLVDYISRVDIVGLNGQWGSGKSVLIDRLCGMPEIKKQYEIIRIDLLSFNLDKLEEVLLMELEEVLGRNRIFSKYSAKLRKLMDGDGFLTQVQTVFLTDTGSMASVFRDLKEDAQKLDKKILIIYEDIDRIADNDTVSKLFDISEKLAGRQIKVVYQFDGEKLQDKGFDRFFMEKYIPYIVNLTEISFEECVEMLCSELELDKFGVVAEEFRFLSGELFDDYMLKKALGIENARFEIMMKGIAIRKVKILLQELQVLLSDNEVLREKSIRKIVIVFLLMKHVFYGCYDMLNLVERPVNSLIFRYENEEYTMAQLIYQRRLNMQDNSKGMSIENLRTVFKDQSNRNVYSILAMLGYQFDMIDGENGEERRAGDDQQDVNERLRLIGVEKVEDISKRNDNEKIDRIIWNLYANGKSEYTNMEHIVSKLTKDVLSEPAEDQEEAWISFGNDMFQEKNVWKDNKTVFRVGVKAFLTIFQAFRITQVSTEQWLKLLDFYFRNEKIEEIGVELIEVLNYCDLQKRRVFLWVIRKFSRLMITGNMNGFECYHKFLLEYLRATEYLGYNRRYESWMLDFKADVPDYAKHVRKILQQCVSDLKVKRDKCRSDLIRQELQDIIVFVERNIEMVDNPNRIKKPGVGFSSTMSSKIHHNYPEVYNRLLEKKTSEACSNPEYIEQYLAEVEQAYSKEELSLYEVDLLTEGYE